MLANAWSESTCHKQNLWSKAGYVCKTTTSGQFKGWNPDFLKDKCNYQVRLLLFLLLHNLKLGCEGKSRDIVPPSILGLPRSFLIVKFRLLVSAFSYFFNQNSWPYGGGKVDRLVSHDRPVQRPHYCRRRTDPPFNLRHWNKIVNSSIWGKVSPSTQRLQAKFPLINRNLTVSPEQCEIRNGPRSQRPLSPFSPPAPYQSHRLVAADQLEPIDGQRQSLLFVWEKVERTIQLAAFT